MIESESKMLPMISRALASQGKDEAEGPESTATAKKRPMDEQEA